MSEKEKREIEICEKFLRSCSAYKSLKFRVSPQDPPAPDCLVEFFGDLPKRVELSEMVDKGIAEKFYGQKVEPSGGFFDDEILSERILEKIQKKYKTDSNETELLLYFLIQPVWPEETMLEQVKKTVDQYGRGPFGRIWLFSEPREEVIGLI